MPSLRVVLDTNVLASGITRPFGTPGHIVGAWRQGALEVVLSKYILDELARILPKLSKVWMAPEESRALADGLLFLAEIVEPTLDVDPALRDKADGPVLGTLLASKADYLITGDKDLLVLAERYPIVTPVAFWQRHGS